MLYNAIGMEEMPGQKQRSLGVLVAVSEEATGAGTMQRENAREEGRRGDTKGDVTGSAKEVLAERMRKVCTSRRAA